jgi:hypothetical protein
LEYQQAEDTIQQLLRELMLLREIVNRVSALSSSAAASNGGSPTHADAAAATASAGGAAAAAGAGLSNKRISRSKLLGELQQLRQAKAAAESRQVSLLQRLGALEAEKERAEESQEMISRETAKLLDDKRQLLNDLGERRRWWWGWRVVQGGGGGVAGCCNGLPLQPTLRHGDGGMGAAASSRLAASAVACLHAVGCECMSMLAPAYVCIAKQCSFCCEMVDVHVHTGQFSMQDTAVHDGRALCNCSCMDCWFMLSAGASPAVASIAAAAAAGSKDDAVRGLEAGLDHLQHQLELALTDRQVLLEQLAKVADKGEMEALQQALQEEGGGGSRRQSGAGMYGDEQQQFDEHQLLLQELEALQVQMQAEGLGDSGCSNQPVMA